jgi:hypothetical protein
MSTIHLQTVNEGRFYKATVRFLAGQRKICPPGSAYGVDEDRAIAIRKDAIRSMERGHARKSLPVRKTMTGVKLAPGAGS